MKGLLALVLVLMLGMSVYNWMEIRALRQEISDLRTKVDQSQSGGLTDQTLQKAMEMMVQARVALANTDWSKARTAYESARQQIGAAASAANEKAGPALRWLEDQARDIGKQIQQRVPGGR